MYFLLIIAILLQIFVGYNTHPAGNFNYACSDGEEYDMCRSPCETSCDNIRRGFQTNCSRSCVAGCFCKRGLVRADDYSCVPPSACIPPSCPENEEYLECGSPCALNCSNLYQDIFCTKPCHRGCFCKPNFVRDSNGKCIDPRDCSRDGRQLCPFNEIYVSCVNFCNTCSRSEQCNIPYCVPGCDCKPGFSRNFYGRCVSEEECIAENDGFQHSCGTNEVYTPCDNYCDDCILKGRCESVEDYCDPGCTCRQGFFRNENGICIPERDCPGTRQPVCPPGEQYYVCIPTCRVTCDTYDDVNALCDTSCIRGCFCKGGHIRRSDGVCVPPTECPAKNLRCPAGEAFYQCLPTCRTSCRTLNITSGVCSTECKPGCFCQPGLVRDDSGRCIRPTECPQPVNRTCPPGEIFYDCVPSCRNTCETFNSTRPCPLVCRPGCFCRAGFVRRQDGTCVRPRSCPIPCRPNEEFRSCGSACPVTCENFNRTQPCTEQCVRGCFCKRGFVLGPRRTCIRRADCPHIPTRPCLEKPGFIRCSGFQGRRGGGDDSDLENETQSTTPPSAVTTVTVANESQSETSNASSLMDPISTNPTTSSDKAPDTTVAAETTVSNSSSSNITTTEIPSQTTEKKAEPTTQGATNAADTSPSNVTESGSTVAQTVTSTVISTGSVETTSVNSTAGP